MIFNYYDFAYKVCEAKQAKLDPDSEDDQTDVSTSSKKQGDVLKEGKENIAPCDLPKENKKKRKRKLVKKVHIQMKFETKNSTLYFNCRVSQKEKGQVDLRNKSRKRYGYTCCF